MLRYFFANLAITVNLYSLAVHQTKGSILFGTFSSDCTVSAVGRNHLLYLHLCHGCLHHQCPQSTPMWMAVFHFHYRSHLLHFVVILVPVMPMYLYFLLPTDILDCDSVDLRQQLCV